MDPISDIVAHGVILELIINEYNVLGIMADKDLYLED
jgi:hypothetical protein